MYFDSYGLASNSPHRKAFRANVNYAQAPDLPHYNWWRNNTDILGTGFECPAKEISNDFDPETETNQKKSRPQYTFENNLNHVPYLVDFYNHIQNNDYKVEIPAKDYLAHEQSEGTLYFNGKLNDLRKYYNFDGSVPSDISYSIIDIDCHTKGTKEDALAARKIVNEELSGEFYWEWSQGGIGINILIGIEYFKTSSMFDEGNYCDNFKDALKKLCHKITVRCLAAGINIDIVEAKALPPTYETNHLDQITKITRGSLGRCPRNLLAASFTPIITFEELENIIEEDNQIIALPVKKEIEKKIKNAGSLNYDLKLVTVQNINHCLNYLNMLGVEAPDISVNCGHQFGNTKLDLAICYLCFIIAAENNTVCSTKFIQLVYDEAYKVIKRQFHGSRWKANRDLLGSLNIIGQTEKDGNLYIPPESTLIQMDGEETQQKKGKACQYAINKESLEKFHEYLKAQKEVCLSFSSCVLQSILSAANQPYFAYKCPTLDPRIIEVQGRTIHSFVLNAA